MPSSTTGSFARLAANITTGMRMTTPTSKKSGMPTTKAISAIAQGSRLTGVLDMIVSTITSAPPEDISRVPMIEPRMISRPTPATVEPRPLVKLLNRSM